MSEGCTLGQAPHTEGDSRVFRGTCEQGVHTGAGPAHRGGVLRFFGGPVSKACILGQASPTEDSQGILGGPVSECCILGRAPSAEAPAGGFGCLLSEECSLGQTVL